MKKIFLLSGENPELAKSEILALAGKKNGELIDNVFMLDCDFKYKRLALAKRVYEFLFECSYNDLEKEMEKFPWNKIYAKSFSVKIANIFPATHQKKESELAKYIWDAVEEPKVDLKYSQTKIELIVTEKKIIVGKVICNVKHEFNNRRAHKRPEHHPTSLHPKIARACVNLTGIKTGRVLVDPFCGTGGILLEAGLMRFNTIGYDISEKMIKMCQKNLEHFKVKRFHLELRDATQISEMIDYVVTDLPYGRSSLVLGNLEELYIKFLKNLKEILREKAVVIFPDFVNHSKIIKSVGMKKEKEFTIYVHKSLSRKIVLLSK